MVLVKFRFLFIILLFLFSACISVDIQKGYYGQLKYEDAQFIHPFSIDSTDVVRDQKSKLYLTEINSNDVKQCLNKYTYTWIHIWRAYCGGSKCMPLYYYEKIDRQFRDKGVKCLMVSIDYDLKDLRSHAQRATFDREIYVLRHNDYGSNGDEAQKKFTQEIAPSDLSKKTLMMDDYLIFKKDKLIYRGQDISSQILDSLLHNNV